MKLPLTPAVLALIALALMTGCGRERKAQRLVAEGHEALAAHKLSDAKKRFLEANELDTENAEPLRGLALAHLGRGQSNPAYQALKRGLELKPDDAEMRSLMSATLLRANQPQRAAKEAIRALELDPSRTEALIVFAKSQRTEETAQALAFLDSLAGPDDPIADLQIARAIARAKMGQPAEAVDRIELALRADPNSSEAYLVLARLSWQLDQLDQAENRFAQAIERAAPYSLAAYEYARFKRRTGDLAAARQALERFIATAPEHVLALGELADLCLETGALASGIAYAARALELDRNDPQALLLDGKLNIAAGEHERAITSLEALTRAYPNSGNAHLQLAIALLGADRPNDAIARLRQARILSPDSSEANILLATLDISQSDLQGAIAKLQAFAHDHPKNLEVKKFLADTLLIKGNADEALALYNALLEQDPANPDTPYSAALAYIQKRDVRSAQQMLDRALQIDNGHFPSIEQLVTIDRALGAFAAAEERLERFASAHEPPDGFYLVSGILALDQDRRGEAETALEKAIALNPKNTRAYHLLSQLLIEDRREDEAIARLEAALAADPRDLGAHMRLGSLREQRRQYEASAEHYRRAIAIDPNFSPALNNLAYLSSVHLGDLETAYQLASHARQLRPTDPATADTLGWILFQQGKFAWALSLINEAAGKLPSNSEVLHHLGMTHYMLGNADAARSALAAVASRNPELAAAEEIDRRLRVLAIDPTRMTSAEWDHIEQALKADSNDTIALATQAQALRQKGDDAGAARALHRLLESAPDNASALVQLAQIDRAKGRYAQAFEHAKRAYSIQPDNFETIATLGLLARENGQSRWAATLLARAGEVGAANPEMRYALGLSAFATGNLDTALAALRSVPNESVYGERAVQLSAIAAAYQETGSHALDSVLENPYRDDALADRARQAIRFHLLGEVAKAAATYSEIMAAYPDFKPAKRQAALLATRSGRFDAETLRLAQSALALHPNDPTLTLAVGIQLHRQKQHRNALELLKALPVSAEALFYRGLAAAAERDPDAARTHLQAALDRGGLLPEQEQEAIDTLRKLEAPAAAPLR